MDVASGRPCRRRFVHGLPAGRPLGACSFGYFACTSKKSNSPVATEFLRQNGRNSPQTVQVRWHCFVRFKVARCTGHVCYGRVPFFACPKKGTKERHPVDAALRASREQTCSSRVVSTRHPVAERLNAPSMALFPGLHRSAHGGIKRGRKIQIRAACKECHSCHQFEDTQRRESLRLDLLVVAWRVV